MMSLPELSIRRPVFAWMLMAAIILFGYLSFRRLGLSQLPDVDSPVVSVSLNLPGAAPEVVESQALDPIEDAIMELSGIKSVTSTATQASGSIAIEFELGRDIDEQMQQVQNKINQVGNVLPVNLRPPTIRKSNPEDQPILWVALTSDDPNEKPIDMMIYARNYLYDQFATIPGVGNVALGGYVDPALRVWVDQNKMDYFNMTSDDLLTSVTAEHIERPEGRMEGNGHEWNIRVLGEATSPTEFGNLMLESRANQGPNYHLTRLSDVSALEEGIQDVRKLSRFNGKKAVALGILKQHGSNAVEVAELVRAKLKEIEPVIPKKYHVDIRSDNTRFIKQAVDELLFTLSLSALLTSLVCYLFLGSWTSTLNVLMSIPTSIIGAFTAFLIFNFTLNTFTLLGLSLAIGIVVDDSIMMLENIVRHRELGEGRREAALKGSKEITFAALAATIAVVAIFLPVVFMQGVIGRYFLQYGITVTVAVMLSLLEALTLTPMRCSRYLSVNPNPTGLAGFVERLFHRLAFQYQRVLAILLRHRAVTLIITAILFAASIYSAKFIPSEMLPPQDQSMVLMRYKLPVGTALAITDRRSRELEDFILKQPEVNGVFSSVGGFGADAVNQGQLQVSLVAPNMRKFSQKQLMDKWRVELKTALTSTEGMDTEADEAATTKHLQGEGKFRDKAGSRGSQLANIDDEHKEKKPHEHKGGGARRPGRGGTATYNGMQINFQDMSTKGFASSRGFPVEFIIQGPDWDKLDALSKEMMAAMEKTDYVVDVNTDIQPGMPEVQLIPNRKKLAARGVSLSTVTGVINALVGGHLFEKENSYSKAGHRYQVELRLIAGQRDTVPDLDRISVRNSVGEAVRLSELVDRQIRPSLILISRLNRSRAIQVYGNPAPGHSQQEAMANVEKLARGMLPPGYSLKMTGSSQSFRETFQSLLYALMFGILVSYMVLASQFNSFIHPVTVLMALPFSFSGAFIGLIICHQSINIYSLIGFILLMGIVKKNSILLVDFTNEVRKTDKTDVHTSLLKACPVRLRPILMTSIATVAGALPEALSIGPGAETTIPMAIAIIGGVVASTLLTLFIVPCVYSLLSRFESVDTLEPDRHSHVETSRNSAAI
jgi:multidrug efflux pump subunit AcrB